MPSYSIRRLLLVQLMVVVALSAGCHSRSEPATVNEEAGPAGEPEQYSATLVRSIDDGTWREVSVTRIARSGELTREEWTDESEPRALIWRPDLGKGFLLALNKKVYVEFQLAENAGREPPPGPPPVEPSRPADSDAQQSASAVDPRVMERAFSDAPLPVRVETRLLPDQMIEGHPCRVIEQRRVFRDGQMEVTRTWRARDLAELALRVETEPEPATGGVKVITERRDVKVEAPKELFTVPADFKRVDKLPL